jgi:peptidoglycan/LPS O-acetylase OafA/YrhL
MKETNSRILELDALRGIAVIWIVIYHFTFRYQELYYIGGEPFFDFWYPRVALKCFMMLSGFSIFMTLVRAKSGIEFLMFRAVRLYPVFWVSVLLTFCVVSIFSLPGRETTFREMLWNLTMIPNQFHARLVDGAYWYMELVLKFYLAIFIIVITKSIKYIRQILYVWIILGLGAPIIVEMSLPMNMQGFGIACYNTVADILFIKEIPLFAMGITFFLVYQKDSFSIWDVGLILLALGDIYRNNRIDDFLVILFLTAVFLLFVKGKLSFIRVRPLLFLGGISYPLYLIHQNIGYVIIRASLSFFPNPLPGVVVALAMGLLIATFLSHMVEQPMKMMMRKWYKA